MVKEPVQQPVADLVHLPFVAGDEQQRHFVFVRAAAGNHNGEITKQRSAASQIDPPC